MATWTYKSKLLQILLLERKSKLDEAGYAYRIVLSVLKVPNSPNFWLWFH